MCLSALFTFLPAKDADIPFPSETVIECVLELRRKILLPLESTISRTIFPKVSYRQSQKSVNLFEAVLNHAMSRSTSAVSFFPDELEELETCSCVARLVAKNSGVKQIGARFSSICFLGDFNLVGNRLEKVGSIVLEPMPDFVSENKRRQTFCRDVDELNRAILKSGVCTA